MELSRKVSLSSWLKNLSKRLEVATPADGAVVEDGQFLPDFCSGWIVRITSYNVCYTKLLWCRDRVELIGCRYKQYFGEIEAHIEIVVEKIPILFRV